MTVYDAEFFRHFNIKALIKYQPASHFILINLVFTYQVLSVFCSLY